MKPGGVSCCDSGSGIVLKSVGAMFQIFGKRMYVYLEKKNERTTERV